MRMHAQADRSAQLSRKLLATTASIATVERARAENIAAAALQWLRTACARAHRRRRRSGRLPSRKRAVEKRAKKLHTRTRCKPLFCLADLPACVCASEKRASQVNSGSLRIFARATRDGNKQTRARAVTRLRTHPPARL